MTASQPFHLIPVQRVADAQGGLCRTCGSVFTIETCPYWAWSKSVAMHRAGTGHRVELFARLAVVR